MNDRTRVYIEKKRIEAKKRFKKRLYKFSMHRSANKLPILLAQLGVIKSKVFREYLDAMDVAFTRHMAQMDIASSYEEPKTYGRGPKSIKPTKSRGR